MDRSFTHVVDDLHAAPPAVEGQLEESPIKVFFFDVHWMWREALASILRQEQDIELSAVSEDAGGWLEEVVTSRPDVTMVEPLLREGRLGINDLIVLRNRLPATKLVVFTELADQETLRGAVAAGVSGFLLKQEILSPTMVVNAIRSIHSGGGWLTPSVTAKVLRVIQGEAERDRHGLTKRERQVLESIAEGFDNRRIARTLGIDERTVANHVSNLLFKMNARNRTEASAIARREGLLHD